MGDRAMIAIEQHPYEGTKGSGRIYLYTHWTGLQLPQTLQNALRRGRQSWADEPYLTRVIFCEMVRGEELRDDGFGIASYTIDSDREHNLIVDVERQTVSLEHRPIGPVTHSWDFETFLGLSVEFLEKVWDT